MLRPGFKTAGALALAVLLAGCGGAGVGSSVGSAMQRTGGPNANTTRVNPNDYQEDPNAKPEDPVLYARAQCWIKVEQQKALKGIDQRIAFVDKCVADRLGGAS